MEGVNEKHIKIQLSDCPQVIEKGKQKLRKSNVSIVREDETKVLKGYKETST